jgi:hypothetical protein
MTSFQIAKAWLQRNGASELDATMARLTVIVGNKNVTEFAESDGSRTDHLEIPAYFLAEWVAENWWPLLWEPRKSEDGVDDVEFTGRHSLLAAQHGFVLPRVTFTPTGRTIRIVAHAREATFADVRFLNSSEASPPRSDVEEELSAFVSAVCTRLEKRKIADTGLQQAWRLVRDVTADERQFCEFAGALGLAPDDVDDHTAALLDRHLEKFGQRLLMDLCLVALPTSFRAIAEVAEAAFEGLQTAPAASLEPLLRLSMPVDNFSVPAWRRGVQAARQLRKRLGIEDMDPGGASRVFEQLGLDPNKHSAHSANEVSLTGAVARSDAEVRVALLQPAATQRRFTAARAVFSAWTSEAHEKRYLTSSVTRDQQANRAFAAELTSPYALLRARSRSSKLTQDQVFDLASELQIGADVVSKHALNNGLQVRAI